MIYDMTVRIWSGLAGGNHYQKNNNPYKILLFHVAYIHSIFFFLLVLLLQYVTLFQSRVLAKY